MKIRVLCVGRKDPEWLSTGVAEYRRRLPPHLPLEQVTLPPSKHVARNAADKQKIVAEEGERILQQIDRSDWVVALDERGKMRSSRELAARLDDWSIAGHSVVFVVGGVNGLAPAVMDRSNEKMSLSTLTFPHHLVRLILVEALYRAWTINAGHPYHRD